MSTKKVIGRAAVKALETVSTTLAPVEDRLVLREWKDIEPPIFILGSPRSGTTLLYQLLVYGYETAYFDNWTSLFPRIPVTATWFEHRLMGKRPVPASFQSSYGRTKGLRGPSEFGALWYRWFPKGEHVYVQPGKTEWTSLMQVRGTLAGMAKVVGKPLVVKNTFNSMRIAPILEAVPEAVFLVIRRDPILTAASILQGRIDLYGDPDVWLGLPPREIDEIRARPNWEQAVDQMFFIYQQIDEDRKRFGVERFLDIEYLQLCKDVRLEMKRITQFLEGHSLVLRWKQELPTHFQVSQKQNLSVEDYERIAHRVSEMWV